MNSNVISTVPASGWNSTNSLGVSLPAASVLGTMNATSYMSVLSAVYSMPCVLSFRASMYTS